MRIALILGVLGGCVAGVADGPDATETTPTPVQSAPTAESDGFGLHDVAGPVAGMAGYTIERTPDATRCGGIAVRVVRNGSEVVASEDQLLADLFTAQYPLGLDFGDATRAASLNKLNSWLHDVKSRTEAAVTVYSAKVSDGDPAVTVPATARTVQATRYFAGLLVRAEIPIDMRSGEYAGEKQDAFCDKLAEAAQPLIVKADKAATVCARHAETLPAGWWSAVCAH